MRIHTVNDTYSFVNRMLEIELLTAWLILYIHGEHGFTHSKKVVRNRHDQSIYHLL